MSDRSSEFESLQIPDIEKQNIKELTGLLEKAAHELKYDIETQLIGGVIKKEWPRKDIDLLVDIRNVLPYKKKSEQVEGKFNILKTIVTKALAGNSKFKIGISISPYPDPQLDDSEILAHNGSVMIKPSEGTLIELVNNST